mmetsp:Transcript_18946/g.47317  ORF Transcript_18946/g.47317 Transcript_18946/m.47317 type:complete len:281 (-) Transcript_18946:671-1513(-)
MLVPSRFSFKMRTRRLFRVHVRTAGGEERSCTGTATVEVVVEEGERAVLGSDDGSTTSTTAPVALAVDESSWTTPAATVSLSTAPIPRRWIRFRPRSSATRLFKAGLSKRPATEAMRFSRRERHRSFCRDVREQRDNARTLCRRLKSRTRRAAAAGDEKDDDVERGGGWSNNSCKTPLSTSGPKPAPCRKQLGDSELPSCCWIEFPPAATATSPALWAIFIPFASFSLALFSFSSFSPSIFASISRTKFPRARTSRFTNPFSAAFGFSIAFERPSAISSF